MKKAIEWILSKLFPPKFDPIRDFNDTIYYKTDDGVHHWVNMGPLNLVGEEQEGSCGTAQPKKYRDGIHRMMVEGRL